MLLFASLPSWSGRSENDASTQVLQGSGSWRSISPVFPREIIRSLHEVMEICADRNVPVLFHTNEPVGHVYPGKTPVQPGEIYDLLKHYPSNKIVLAHWGGGLFFYSLLKKEVRDVIKNVWFDTAASPYLYVPQVYRMAGEFVGFEKILFGSDYPLLSPKLLSRNGTGRAVRGIRPRNLRRKCREVTLDSILVKRIKTP